MVEKLQYGASSIRVLEGLEGVRRRPAMYIGGTSKEGLHHLVYEVVDNAVDEAMAGFGTEIKVSINKDGSVTVEDNGRGIPVDIHSTYKIPAVEVALTKLHAGGKFDKKSYAISGGLHGVGISVVNALSKKLIVEVNRDGKVYRQEYSRGKPKTKLKVVGKSKNSGTKITFWSDDEIFSITNFDYKFLETRFREIAFLNAGLKITLIDETKNEKEEFFAKGGLIEFVKWINKSKDVLHKPIYFKRDVNGTHIEVSVQYNSGFQENIFGFVNTINTVEGGTHVSGFKTALTRVINDYAKKKNLLKSGNLTGDDVREGLTAIISVKIPDPQFEGQTKTKLGNSEIKGFVDSAVTQLLGEFFEENPSVAKKVASKAIDSAKARLAAKKAKDLVRRKNAFSLGGLPGKLSDCSTKKSENTELYIVEGESAGGCFSGDTKVALADGRNLSFWELVEEDKRGKMNFCYTIKKDGSIGFAEIENPRKTKKNVSVIKIVLDDGKEIICTPDHKFMLRNKKYKSAKDLTAEDSLMPLYRKLSKIGGKISMKTFCLRSLENPNKPTQGFLDNNFDSMVEAIKNYNHRIKRIENLNMKMDVYDLEVEETHNFALASGVFVHNSAKMARNKEYQAILPLKGKILNVEKSNPVRALSSEEVANIITAIGTGVREEFNPSKLRYNKIIIMTDADSVTYDTPILLFNKSTKMMEDWLVGDFIENKINFKNYQLMSFDNGRLVLSDIFNVIKHPVRTKIYSIDTIKKYNVEVTGDHSVYIYKNGKVTPKEVRNIKTGEFLVIPNKIPNIEEDIEIDLTSELNKLPETQKKNVWIKVNKKDIKKIPETALIDICLDDWKKIKLRRQNKFSRRELSKKLGIYLTILNQWELKIDNVRPKFKLLNKYFELIGLDLSDFNYDVFINFYDFEKEINDKSLLNKAELFNSNTKNSFKLKFRVNKSLAYFLGVYLGDGCYSFNKKSPNRFIFSLNTEDKKYYLNKLEEILNKKFGIFFSRCIKGRSLQLHFHSFAFVLLLKKLGLLKLKSDKKFIPNIFYNVSEDIKKSLLEGLLHTDGYIHPKEKRMVHTSISKKLITGILNLYRQLGIFPNFQKRKTHGNKFERNNKERYDLIINYNELNKIKDVWGSHKKGDLLNEELKRTRMLVRKNNFFKISRDFSAIKITNIKEMGYNKKNIYDFSVKKTQNFIGGIGNILLHNTDGGHIKTLLLTFFFRFMPQLIENGNVFAAMPPLYRVRKKKDHYVYSDEELKKMIEKLGNAKITRFKGLGEMSSVQLWNTTMNPKTRRIKKIFIEDAVEADRVFSMLMGSNVPERKQFIQENAKEADLDV